MSTKKNSKGPRFPSRASQPANPMVQAGYVREKLVKRHVGDSHMVNVMAMMDPGAYSQGSTTIPSRAPWLRSVTTESLVLKLSTADGSVNGSGQFVIEAKARPDGTLSVLSSQSDVENNDGASGQLSVFEATSGSNVIPSWGLTHGDVSAIAVPCVITAGSVATWAVPVSSTGGGNVTVGIRDSTQSATFTYRAYTGPANALVASGTVNLNCTAGSSGTGTLALPANCTHVSLEYSKATLRAMLTAIPYLIPGGAATYALTTRGRTYNLQTLQDVDQLRAYRVVGQSLLLTYTGSSLQNGGEIAIARVFSTWIPDPTTGVYQSILKLPKSRRYAGRVAQGAHSFWVPATVEDLEPKLYGLGYDELERPSYKLVAAGALDDPSESIMLQLETVIEFSTDAPSYASVEYSPPWNNFDVALQVLAGINPNGENPDHLKKIAAFASTKAKQLLRYALDNPGEAAATIASLMAILA